MSSGPICESRDAALSDWTGSFAPRAIATQTAAQPAHIITKSEVKSQRVNILQPREAAEALALKSLHSLNLRQEVLEKILDSVPKRRR